MYIRKLGTISQFWAYTVGDNELLKYMADQAVTVSQNKERTSDVPGCINYSYFS